MPTDVTGQGGKFARNITTIYTPRYESLIQRHRLRRIGVVRDCRWSRLDERMCFFFFGSCGSSGKEGILSFEYVISINTIFDTPHKERISLRYICGGGD